MTYAFTHMGSFLLLLFLRTPIPPGPRPISQPRGPYPSLEAQIPTSRPKSQPQGPNSIWHTQLRFCHVMFFRFPPTPFSSRLILIPLHCLLYHLSLSKGVLDSSAFSSINSSSFIFITRFLMPSRISFGKRLCPSICLSVKSSVCLFVKHLTPFLHKDVGSSIKNFVLFPCTLK